jgi:hypothetical protein
MANKPSRRRARNLDDQTLEKIVEILDTWNLTKLTWNLLIEQILIRLRLRYTRQALNNYARIKDAFKARKLTLSMSSYKEPRTETLEQQRIARLEAENQRLKQENNALLEQFNRWVYNGYLKQMDARMREFMSMPLPPTHREPSKIQR